MRTTYLPLIAVVLAVLALFSRPTLAEEEEIAYVLVEENQTLTEPGKTTTVDNVTTTNVTVTNQTTTTGDATVRHSHQTPSHIIMRKLLLIQNLHR